MEKSSQWDCKVGAKTMKFYSSTSVWRVALRVQAIRFLAAQDEAKPRGFGSVGSPSFRPGWSTSPNPRVEGCVAGGRRSSRSVARRVQTGWLAAARGEAIPGGHGSSGTLFFPALDGASPFQEQARLQRLHASVLM